ncbi:hypothetical protein Bint_2588 [Brachyspira intermedia PWS/A]|uniref:Uncharacterized protein n=1 Tax=Brachyspira intermedia (strain ATCC 51140 / PWS/A) TaxID=1045858 RepID=G0ENW2_BRAIP|nr:hypothetical protein [Brachyspira intermedia]AEM23192.1 hypothetical protein Bint_2588 [Brachyspira intermedia PWS/A]
MNNTSSEIVLNDQEVQDFVTFLNEKKEFLDTGLGAFHTDNHSNW